MRDAAVLGNTHEAWASRSILTVLKSFCYECMGGTKGAQLECTTKSCPLYPWRNARSLKGGFRNAVNVLTEAGRGDLAVKLVNKLEDTSQWPEDDTPSEPNMAEEV